VYFLVTGRMSVCKSISAKTFKVTHKLGPGDHFGLTAYYSQSQKYQDLAKAITFCDMQVLMFDDLQDLLQSHPDIAETFETEKQHPNGIRKGDAFYGTEPPPQAASKFTSAARVVSGVRRLRKTSDSPSQTKRTIRKQLEAKRTLRMEKISLAAQNMDPSLSPAIRDVHRTSSGMPTRRVSSGMPGRSTIQVKTVPAHPRAQDSVYGHRETEVVESIIDEPDAIVAAQQAIDQQVAAIHGPSRDL